MKVRTKLGVAIALPIVVLGGTLLLHIHTTRRTVATVHELTDIWLMVHRTSIEQQGRAAQLEENAAKYLVTRDAGYLARLHELADTFEEEVRRLRALPLDGRAGHEIVRLGEAWAIFKPIPGRLEAAVRSGNASDRVALDSALAHAIDHLRFQADQVSQSSHEAMDSRLELSQRAAREAEQVSFWAAVAALALSTLVVLLVVRSIARPISRLAAGTLEIGRGRFEHRLDDQHADEFAVVASEFNRMAARLGEVDRLKRDFVATVSHDLKTPLASMDETTEVLLEEVAGPLTAQQRRLLLLQRECAIRLRRMLGQLLDLSSLDSMQEPVRETVHLSDLVLESLRQADPSGVSGENRIHYIRPDAPVRLVGDGDRIRQVIDNLLDNALKFSPPDSTVHVELSLLEDRPADIPPYRWASVTGDPARGSVAWLTVADSGPGVAEGQHDLIFSRFHRAGHRECARGRGVGLGLAICREICHAHGGMIWVANRPGVGSVFHVLLPGAHSVAGEPPIRTARETSASVT